MNLHNFPYFTQPKNPQKKYYKFQQHSLLTALHKKSTHAHNVFFGFGFCALLERRVDEIKNSKSKIILQLPHSSFARYHRIFNFFGPPLCICICNICFHVQMCIILYFYVHMCIISYIYVQMCITM